MLIGSSPFSHPQIQLTIVINSQKVHATAAQHRWFYHHKHLFAPLVGAKSHFFANLETEIKGLAPEKRSIVKLEEIEQQPKLIKGGQMKDYQVRRTYRGVLYAVSLTGVLAPRIVLPCVDA